MSDWLIASSYVIGQGHISKNMPCQDKTFKLIDRKYYIKKRKKRFLKHKIIPISINTLDTRSSFYGLSLADGAGSCKYSDIGAELITKKILQYIKINFDNLFIDESIRLTLTSHIENELYKITTDNIAFKDLSSTLLFIAIKNNKFIIGHIGDGIIGMLDKSDNLKIISKPDNGEFSNSTFFTTSINYKDRLRLLKGTLKNSKGFIVMSDGAGESLYNKKEELLSDTSSVIINWLKTHNERDVEEALCSNLEQIISKNTSDDCSIGIMRLKETIKYSVPT